MILILIVVWSFLTILVIHMNHKLCRNHVAIKDAFFWDQDDNMVNKHVFKSGKVVEAFMSHFNATSKAIKGETQRFFIYMN